LRQAQGVFVLKKNAAWNKFANDVPVTDGMAIQIGKDGLFSLVVPKRGLTNSSATYTSGELNNAASFNGTSSDLSGSDSAVHIVGKISAAFRINASGLPTSGNLTVLAGGDHGGTMGWFVDLDNRSGPLKLRSGSYNVGDDNLAIWNVSGWSAEAWHHVVGIWDSTNCVLYFDGIAQLCCPQ